MNEVDRQWLVETIEEVHFMLATAERPCIQAGAQPEWEEATGSVWELLEALKEEQ